MRRQKSPPNKEERRALRQRMIGASDVRQPPDFVIIGAQKSGTTSLYSYLTGHPDIGAATKKEVHYFDRFYHKGIDWYLAHFPERGEFPVVGEASPSYLFHPEVPARLRRTVPSAKLIALLRDPVERAYSQHQMRIRRVGAIPFEAAIERELERLEATDGLPGPAGHSHFLARGIYVEQLRRWLAVFPQEQLLVLKSEDFFARPMETLSQTLGFLGLSSWSPEQYDQHNAGTYEGGMRPETRERLREYFAPHNQRLYEMLDWNLGWDDV